jgi:hypothetical protein
MVNPQISRVHQNEGELYTRTRLVDTNKAATQRVNDSILGPLLALDDSGNPITVCADDGFLVEATANLVVKVNAGWALHYVNEDHSADPYALLWRRAVLAADALLSVDGGGAADRTDIVQVRAVETQQDALTVPYMDGAGNKSNVSVYTRYLDSCEVQVKTGVEGGPVPTPDAGWFKVAEIFVGLGAVAIVPGDITDTRTAPQTSFAASVLDLLVRNNLLVRNDLTVWDDLTLGGDGSPVESRVVFRRSQGAGGQWVLEVHGRDAGEGAAAYQIFLRATRRTYAGDGVDTVEWRVAGPDGYPNGPADDGDACDVVLGGSVGMRAMRIRATEDAGGNKLLRFMLDDALPETNPPAALLDVYEDGRLALPQSPSIAVKLPINSGSVDAATTSKINANGEVVITDAAVQATYLLDVPDHLDADGVTLEPVTVDVWMKTPNTNGGSVTAQVMQLDDPLAAGATTPNAVSDVKSWAGNPTGAVSKQTITLNGAYAPGSGKPLMLVLIAGTGDVARLRAVTVNYTRHRLP